MIKIPNVFTWSNNDTTDIWCILLLKDFGSLDFHVSRSKAFTTKILAKTQPFSTYLIYLKLNQGDHLGDMHMPLDHTTWTHSKFNLYIEYTHFWRILQVITCCKFMDTVGKHVTLQLVVAYFVITEVRTKNTLGQKMYHVRNKWNSSKVKLKITKLQDTKSKHYHIFLCISWFKCFLPTLCFHSYNPL